jgi:hypothetical protein
MRTCGLRLVPFAVAILLPGIGLAGRKADLRLLQRIERVDGPGSGLDADTVRGLTPAQMGEAADVGQLKARLDALEAKVNGMTGGPPFSRDRLYTHASRVLQSEGTERLITVDCDDANDVAINCSGGAYDGSTAFPITWMGVVLRADDQGNPLPERCMLVVGEGATTPNLEATIRCLQVP